MRRLPRNLTTALTLLTLLTAAGCGDEKGSGVADEKKGAAPGGRVSADPSPLPLAGTEWKVTDVTGGLPKGAERSARFTLTPGEKGGLAGNLGCNRFTTTAKVTGETIVLGPLVSTKMLCDGPKGELEKRVSQVLDQRVTFAVDGHDLTLTGRNGTTLRATAH
ncbi:META domain-containing protein [Streptomyces sp. NPDC006798]|uniref:META domain-containing protein n=1 Tax=Streptomyces sp. NPDC006798 TaxID=3155462 RepID=UPI0033D04CD4